MFRTFWWSGQQQAPLRAAPLSAVAAATALLFLALARYSCEADAEGGSCCYRTQRCYANATCTTSAICTVGSVKTA
jgi:hypothetical protein